MHPAVVVSLLVLALGRPPAAAAEGSAGAGVGPGSAPAAGADLPREFKSVGCPGGEVLLLLSSTGSFVLLFEEAGGAGSRSIRERATGRWRVAGRIVTLEGPAGRIEYAREPVRFTIGAHTFELAGLAWKGADRSGFAERCKTLVDRIGLERAVQRFAPPPPPGEG